MNIYSNVTTYCKENFNYDESIDINNLKKAKEELSEWEFYDYEKNKNFNQTILENLNYKMLIPCINEEYKEKPISVILSLYLNEAHYKIKNFDKKVKNLILNLSKEEFNELNKYDNTGLDLIEILYFHLEQLALPSCILEFNYNESNEIVSSRLKDPFYTFPELDNLKKIKKEFNLKTVSIVNFFNEEFYEYNEHRNNREEYYVYYRDYLKKELSKGKGVSDIKKLEKLKEYLRIITDIELEKEVLNSCKIDKRNFKLIEMQRKLENRRKSLPAKYRIKSNIEKEIKNVIK